MTIKMKTLFWLFPVALAVSTAALWTRKRKFFAGAEDLWI